MVILHEDGSWAQSENNSSGKGSNGLWDLYGVGLYMYYYEDQFVIGKGTPTTYPDASQVVDAVVWGNDDGYMYSSQVSDGNWLIEMSHWGDPVAGSGVFSTSNDGPVLGSIYDGYGKRVGPQDTNSVSDWIISSSHSFGAIDW
jgi:hypothetical protein